MPASTMFCNGKKELNVVIRDWNTVGIATLDDATVHALKVAVVQVLAELPPMMFVQRNGRVWTLEESLDVERLQEGETVYVATRKAEGSVPLRELPLLRSDLPLVKGDHDSLRTVLKVGSDMLKALQGKFGMAYCVNRTFSLGTLLPKRTWIFHGGIARASEEGV